MFMNRLRNLKLMEEDGGAGGGGTPAETPKTPEIDYQKIADMVSGKLNATEDSVLKGYFKNMGLSKEEAEQAISTFKEQKKKNQPDVGELQRQAADAQNQVLLAQIETESLKMAAEIGIDLKTMPYVLKMADTKEVIIEGKVSGEKLKEVLLKVLEDIPQLKTTPENQGAGFKFGAGGGTGGQDATEDALDKIFGVKKK